MPKRGTETDKTPAVWLPTEQMLAGVECPLSGMSQRDTAAAVGVHRDTVNGWMKHEGFVALLKSLREPWYSKMDRIVGRSLDIVDSALSDERRSAGSPRVQLARDMVRDTAGKAWPRGPAPEPERVEQHLHVRWRAVAMRWNADPCWNFFRPHRTRGQGCRTVS